MYPNTASRSLDFARARLQYAQDKTREAIRDARTAQERLDRAQKDMRDAVLLSDEEGITSEMYGIGFKIPERTLPQDLLSVSSDPGATTLDVWDRITGVERTPWCDPDGDTGPRCPEQTEETRPMHSIDKAAFVEGIPDNTDQ